MAQSLCKNFVHLIFSTKQRARLITEEIQPELFKYLGGILRNWESPSLVVGGVEDHVHILFLLSKNHALADIVEEVKSSSSSWIKTKGPDVSGFYWQNGYGAFSVSQSNVPMVQEYIVNQKEHHRQMSFQEELRELLKRHEVSFDERYVWD